MELEDSLETRIQRQEEHLIAKYNGDGQLRMCTLIVKYQVFFTYWSLSTAVLSFEKANLLFHIITLKTFLR